MKKPFLSLLFFMASSCCFSQHITKSDERYLQKKEDSLKTYAVNMIMAAQDEDRFTADGSFTKMFVRALKTSNSFYYPFDSLQTISKIYSPDSTFRIFTWQLVINEDITRQHGAIQMRTSDGSLKLFPLIDKSALIQNPEDTITDNKNWVGALYYKMLEKQNDGKNFYTLLGYDENDRNSTKKLIEVLTFENGAPVFGGPYFSYEEDTAVKPTTSRYIMEFKKDAGPRLVYDADMDMIIAEHLESESNEPKKKWTLIPDGDYEGFKWKNGKWVHVEKVFSYITPEGQEPLPKPVLDPSGNFNQADLKDTKPDQ